MDVKSESALIKMRISLKNCVLAAIFSLLFYIATSYTAICYAKPEKIISLAPSITEEIYLLGAQDLLVGVTSYCKYPPEAQRKEIIGTVLEPNIEKIISLKPDLILATKEGNRQEPIKKLRDLGMQVVVFDGAENFADICHNFLKLGKLLGYGDSAEKIIEDIKQRVERIRRDSIKNDRKKIFWQMGAKPIIGVSSHTYTNDIINFAGGINIFADMPVRYPKLNIEEIIRRNPDIIIVVTMGEITDTELRMWRRFPEINAVRNNRIYVYDMHFACTPTPNNFIVALEKTAELIKAAQ